VKQKCLFRNVLYFGSVTRVAWIFIRKHHAPLHVTVCLVYRLLHALSPDNCISIKTGTSLNVTYKYSKRWFIVQKIILKMCLDLIKFYDLIIFILVILLWKNKRKLMRSPCCVYVYVPQQMVVCVFIVAVMFRRAFV
jgi:hypothetical protein